MKNEFKIRRMLGENYFLHSDNEGNWKLFRWYENKDLYFSEHNKPIMTSETHTEKELFKYAKKNRVYDFERLHLFKGVCIAWLVFLFCIIKNIFLNNSFTNGIWLGLTIYLWIDLVLNTITGNHNHKMKMNYLKEKGRLIRIRCGYREDYDIENRFQLKTKVGKYLISTVDLGINHQLIETLPPLYYETMVFSDDEQNVFEYYQERYTTKEEAIKGHKEAVKVVEKQLKEVSVKDE